MLTRLPCTMDTSPPQSWTTTELRKFLKERAIPYSGYSKAVLVGMVEKAIANPGITEITQPSDVVVAGITRKTVSVNGNVILFPDPRVITSWEKDLTSLPHLTSAKCLVYLLSKGGWSSERAISYEKERGYQLFMESHIDEVELNQEDHNMTYVWALCRRQTAQSEKPYQVWLLLNTTGTIETAGCQCIGDDGSCKHVVALMFAIEDFVSRRGDHASAPTCTDLPCMWNKPRRNTKQIKAVDLDHRMDTSTTCSITPRSEHYRACSFVPNFNPGESFHAFMAQHASRKCYEQVLFPDRLNRQLPTITELAGEFSKSRSALPFVDFVKQHLGNADMDFIQSKTHAQYKSRMWKDQRVGALTSTTFHKAVHYRDSESNNYIVNEIMGLSGFQGNLSTKYGKETEPIAKKLYIKEMRKKHKQFKFVGCGLFINKDNPLFRATPDGIVSCKCCGKGLLEIKCSHKYRLHTGREIAISNTYHVTLGEKNSIVLKNSSPWYTQIQAHLGVAEMEWCDFVMFIQKSPHLTVQRIYLDKSLFDSSAEIAMDFYYKYVLPNLLNSKETPEASNI
ncbi:uncharacterized protein LOC135100387 isoform X1 [Scylla paramamosain]|uniref:uncharacterized protein LOC135100387 isoform X1 n=1 Tax=Scylla paramamosain TaxID=85552 RepID=UPI003083E78F